ncbi:hypothetical protein GUJ93_ZPchr0008g13871 [Zizania palustris]|uniref:DUF7597 domain-containing protein n=1 Tax=Zizania palustris TaxID=103762 RepID=A0A8J5UXB7_ZIZPA|nr:hypothetical protein GUJ93_ZPchr0008g13871 [Zizania palustris]
MANFPLDPLVYVPRGGVLIDGGGALRKRRNVVSLSGQHMHKHEDLAIALCDDNFTALERHEFLMLVHHHLTQQWVDDQLLHAGFHNAPVQEEAFHAQHVNVDPMDDPMVDEVQWGQWPEQNNNVQQIAQVQEELSVEVSGLSVGFNSGSTTLSGNSNSVIAMAQNIEKSLQDSIPRSLSPPSRPRPPIRLVYSRRQRLPVGLNPLPADSDQGMSSGSQQRLDKGKGIRLPDTPSIKNFIQATSDGKLYAELTIGQIQRTAIRYCGLYAEQVGVGKLLEPVRDNVKLISSRSSSSMVVDAVDSA